MNKRIFELEQSLNLGKCNWTLQSWIVLKKSLDTIIKFYKYNYCSNINYFNQKYSQEHLTRDSFLFCTKDELFNLAIKYRDFNLLNSLFDNYLNIDLYICFCAYYGYFDIISKYNTFDTYTIIRLAIPGNHLDIINYVLTQESHTYDISFERLSHYLKLISKVRILSPLDDMLYMSIAYEHGNLIEKFSSLGGNWDIFTPAMLTTVSCKIYPVLLKHVNLKIHLEHMIKQSILENKLKLCQLIISLGYTDYNQMLIYSAVNNSTKITTYLLNLGFCDYQTIFNVSVVTQNFYLVRRMVKHGVDINQSCQIAPYWTSMEIINFLIKRGAKNYINMFLTAVKNNDEAFMDLLLSKYEFEEYDYHDGLKELRQYLSQYRHQSVRKALKTKFRRQHRKIRRDKKLERQLRKEDRFRFKKKTRKLSRK